MPLGPRHGARTPLTDRYWEGATWDTGPDCGRQYEAVRIAVRGLRGEPRPLQASDAKQVGRHSAHASVRRLTASPVSTLWRMQPLAAGVLPPVCYAVSPLEHRLPAGNPQACWSAEQWPDSNLCTTSAAQGGLLQRNGGLRIAAWQAATVLPGGCTKGELTRPGLIAGVLA